MVQLRYTRVPGSPVPIPLVWIVSAVAIIFPSGDRLSADHVVFGPSQPDSQIHAAKPDNKSNFRIDGTYGAPGSCICQIAVCLLVSGDIGSSVVPAVISATICYRRPHFTSGNPGTISVLGGQRMITDRNVIPCPSDNCREAIETSTASARFAAGLWTTAMAF